MPRKKLAKSNIVSSELFALLAQALSPNIPLQHAYKMLRDVLLLVCESQLSETRQRYGNLFAKVDEICRKLQLDSNLTTAIQRARWHCNHLETCTLQTLNTDAEALAWLVSAATNDAIPNELTRNFSAKQPTKNPSHAKIDQRYVRCLVSAVNDDFFLAEADTEDGKQTIRVDYRAPHLAYLRELLHVGQQLNLLDCTSENDVLKPDLVVVEPDFLVDISRIARCFTSYGHHPISYFINRMMPNAVSVPILLGNYASDALDDVLNRGDSFRWTDTLKRNYKENILSYCVCSDFNPQDFKVQTAQQAENIRGIVDSIFADSIGVFSRDKILLEPSFVCEQLGLRGRVDLMTNDMTLLVEQKSGKNYAIERQTPLQHGALQKEDHYVQLLLYYGVLRQNFHLENRHINARLLYSKYPSPNGLVVVNFYKKLFQDAIEFRNRAVVDEYRMANGEVDAYLSQMQSNVLYQQGNASFFERFILPSLNAVLQPLHSMTPLEHAYFCRMMTFVLNEERYSKIGGNVGHGGSLADLWNMPLEEKRETGNIYSDLTIIDKQRSDPSRGYDLIRLRIPAQSTDFLPNFRTGDMVFFYAYPVHSEPDARQSILFQGTITELRTTEIALHLNDSQRNPTLFDDETRVYAIEHAGSEVTTNAAVRGLQQLMATSPHRRNLLLGQREPERDSSVSLTRNYHPDYDEIVLGAMQAQDYFLLIGPPGTGKTSMALRFLVEEELARDAQSAILLMAYTNRAVDEICDTLAKAGLSFLRIGNPYSCDSRFHPYLVDTVLERYATLEQQRDFLKQTRLFVGTTSTLQQREALFRMRHFTLAIIDEASQILEPQLVGLLSNESIKRFVLIGDYKQLPAVVQQSEIESKVNDPLLQSIGLNNCRDALFDRLVRWERTQQRSAFVGILHKQGRMHPEIAAFPNQFFYQREHLEPVPCAHQTEISLNYAAEAQDDLDRLLKTHRVLYFPSKKCVQAGLSKKVNLNEAAMTTDLLRRIHRFYGTQFDAAKSVGVIVPYRNQIATIRAEIEKLHIPELLDVSIDTVERYQGSQRDVIIYSFVVQQRYQLDFLTANRFVEDGNIIDRKLNVALTRARKQLLILGNRTTLCHDTLFASLIRWIKGC